MELELMPRRCPFCGAEPVTHAYFDNNGRLNMFSIQCYNEYCMVQPGIQLYGRKSQRECVSHWNGDYKVANIYTDITEDLKKVFWCGLCGEYVRPNDDQCPHCAAILNEIVEV